jgi:hypothetical protein
MSDNPKCDNCEAPMDEDDRVIHCPATACEQRYCRHCVPVWCDGCGRLIGPNPTQGHPMNNPPNPPEEAKATDEVVLALMSERSAFNAEIDAVQAGWRECQAALRHAEELLANESKNLAQVRSERDAAQRATEEARGEANALGDLLNQITHALGLNAHADPENNQHIIDRAKYLSEQFTADRYVATEQARVAAKKHLETACMYSRMHDDAIAERDAATAALSQARGEWVSVKDRMPTEIDSVVLIARRSPSFGMKVESARYTSDAFIGASAWWHHESYVTHWRPLPKGPSDA